jgi:uncharacterized OsmC-like protein
MTQNEIVVGLDDSSLHCAGSFDAEDSRSRSTNTTSSPRSLTHSLTGPDLREQSTMTSPTGICRGPLESRPQDRSATTVVVNHSAGTQYVATVRRHEVRVDQALDSGGTDEAPCPVELFVVSLATCVAYFAGQYRKRHGVDRAGLAVHAEYRRTNRPPARVASISLRVIVPRLAGRTDEAIACGRLPLHGARHAARTTNRRTSVTGI